MSRTWPRWLSLVGLWLLLSFVFSSQLYWSGYVSPWSRAFAAEAFYWFTWGLLAPAVFWLCRGVHSRPWVLRAPAGTKVKFAVSASLAGDAEKTVELR